MGPVARIVLEAREDPIDAESLRRLVQLLGEPEPSGHGECAPPLDVLEHSDRVEIVVDLPGVDAGGVRVIYGRGTIVVAGRKRPRVCEHSVAFHLAERSFGRFVRAIALTGAFDAGRASASLTAGELRVIIPRIEERRGRDIEIQVTGG
jgi:HSP20 family protein